MNIQLLDPGNGRFVGLLLAVAALIAFIHEILMDAILHGREKS